jgi:hypothetical protein
MACRWSEESIHLAEKSEIRNIIITDGFSVILVPAAVKDIRRERFSISLPDRAYVLGRRKSRRYICLDVGADIIQNDIRLKAVLVDFSPRAFRVKIIPSPADSADRIKTGSPVTINLYRNEATVFSGSCRFIKQIPDRSGKEMVFAPVSDRINVFLKKKNRNPRVQLRPLPNATFEHPFFKKRIQLDIHDISTSGFSVNPSSEDDVLMTGMIFHELFINFAGVLKLRCKAQVVYRREEKNGRILYGFAMLDMDIGTYNRLSHILMNDIDTNTYTCVEVDTDELWDFLFKSGFIYPAKYAAIQTYRHNLKDTYQKLYRDNPEIASQITYQKNGKIFGHVSMLRSYEKTWMVHHLAARSMGSRKTGLSFLKQIMIYFDGLYRLPSVIDYMMFYFRPENRFPDHFFGGFARHFKNPRACSLDLFSYMNYDVSSGPRDLPVEYTLELCTDQDIKELETFYRKVSDGLLLNVLRLDKKDKGSESLSRIYAGAGFVRSYKSYALRRNNGLKAVMIADVSDPGLSLSDFLNGIKIIVADAAGLSWHDMSAAVSRLKDLYKTERIPVMIYPADFPGSAGIECEKRYNLWILDVRYGTQYADYMMENTKLKLKYVFRFLMRKYFKNEP